MKKVLLFSSAFILSASIIVGCKPSKEEIKNNFIKSCSVQFPESIPKKLVEEYCNCSADAMLQKYTVDEITETEKKIKQGDEKAKDAMMKIMEPCLEELTQKAKAYQGK
jgi:hypothetical protein